jgi:flagellar L-ring protein precursor FlgH
VRADRTILGPALCLSAAALQAQPPDVPLPVPQPPSPGIFGADPGALPPSPGGIVPDPGDFGPAPSRPLDLRAAPFGPMTAPPSDDPAFGPLPVRPAPGLMPFPTPGPFTPVIPPRRPISVRDFGWTYIDAPAPREIALHDIVTILVDEKAETQFQSRFNRQRNASFKAELKEFLRLDDEGNLATAVGDGVSIDSNLRGRLQSDGSVVDREGIRYRIAATVVGVLPNGNVVLEARKAISSNDGIWEYTLTGTIASRDIKSDYTAVSETIANLQIEKRQKGKIADSTQRPWGMWLYDKLSPF